jgi:hypothetical protein
MFWSDLRTRLTKHQTAGFGLVEIPVTDYGMESFGTVHAKSWLTGSLFKLPMEKFRKDLKWTISVEHRSV